MFSTAFGDTTTGGEPAATGEISWAQAKWEIDTLANGPWPPMTVTNNGAASVKLQATLDLLAAVFAAGPAD